MVLLRRGSARVRGVCGGLGGSVCSPSDKGFYGSELQCTRMSCLAKKVHYLVSPIHRLRVCGLRCRSWVWRLESLPLCVFEGRARGDFICALVSFGSWEVVREEEVGGRSRFGLSQFSGTGRSAFLGVRTRHIADRDLFSSSSSRLSPAETPERRPPALHNTRALASKFFGLHDAHIDRLPAATGVKGGSSLTSDPAPSRPRADEAAPPRSAQKRPQTFEPARTSATSLNSLGCGAWRRRRGLAGRSRARVSRSYEATDATERCREHS